MTRIYTRTGDDGTTGLCTGRVPKTSIFIEAIGEIDLLNSKLGLCDASQDFISFKCIQENLFCCGAILAGAPGNIEQEKINALEDAMDAWNEDLPELKNFILPGGHPTACLIFEARAIARRAEILVWKVIASSIVTKDQEVLKNVARYLNRLNDYLFVAARWCNKLSNYKEIIWMQN